MLAFIKRAVQYEIERRWNARMLKSVKTMRSMMDNPNYVVYLEEYLRDVGVKKVYHLTLNQLEDAVNYVLRRAEEDEE